jgi:hypothetical protein
MCSFWSSATLDFRFMAGDRMYLNAYVPQLTTEAGVAGFVRGYLFGTMERRRGLELRSVEKLPGGCVSLICGVG